MNYLYVFIDVSGNYDFSAKGTKYLVLTSLICTDVNPGILELHTLKHNIIDYVINLEYFHASEDKQIVRNEIFKIIQKCQNFIIDSIIVEKRKVNPAIRTLDKIYPMIYEYLVKFICKRYEKSGKTNYY